jgi:hypothetical protein
VAFKVIVQGEYLHADFLHILNFEVLLQTQVRKFDPFHPVEESQITQRGVDHVFIG